MGGAGLAEGEGKAIIEAKCTASWGDADAALWDRHASPMTDVGRARFFKVERTFLPDLVRPPVKGRVCCTGSV